MIITLKQNHIQFSDWVASVRTYEGELHNKKQGNGCTANHDQGLALDILGARAECAGYLWLQPVVWHHLAKKTDGLPDLSDFIDVKGKYFDRKDMIVQPNGKPHWAYLSISAEAHPDYRVMGWMMGKDVMQDHYWNFRLPRPAYAVPNKDLLPISELYDLVRAKDMPAANIHV